jgi:hypothetical protein
LCIRARGYRVLSAGRVGVAAGPPAGAHDPGRRLAWAPAANLAAGTALYLFGHSVFLWRLGVASGRSLKVGAVLALLTAPVGHQLDGALQAGALVVVVAGVSAVRGQRTRTAIEEGSHTSG